MAIQGGRIQKANKKFFNAKGKGKVKGKGKDKSYIPKPKNPKPSAKEHPAKDDACHYCKEVGHCKRNCPAYFAELIKAFTVLYGTIVLDHISKKRIKKLQQDGFLKLTDEESFDQCVSCLMGKMTRELFPHRTERVTALLGIIHTDVCGPLRHVSRQEVRSVWKVVLVHGGEVNGGGDDFGVSKSLLGEIPRVVIGESGGEVFGDDGGAV
ncbi:retrotransposon protein, putative, ty1-copia subclass [Tanacetum coccineum]